LFAFRKDATFDRSIRRWKTCDVVDSIRVVIGCVRVGRGDVVDCLAILVNAREEFDVVLVASCEGRLILGLEVE
jgi:hypothetical protein